MTYTTGHTRAERRAALQPARFPCGARPMHTSHEGLA